MHLKSLKLIRFKNYEEEVFEFEPGINAILGRNGSGKTNLLDAIHYLSMTKSAMQVSDLQSIRHDSSFFTLIGQIEKSEKEIEFFCSLKQGTKKVIRFDKIAYEKVSEHIGKIPCVLVSPFDSQIIHGGSESRRKFFDALISQVDHEYLQHLLRYNHNLKQRNSLLKQLYHSNRRDSDLIASYDRMLIDTGRIIHKTRRKFLEEYLPIFLSRYAYLSDDRERVALEYSSQFDEGNAEMLLAGCIDRDIELQRSTFGTHRDKWLFGMDDYDIKKLGSQGQQKTYILSLKSAQFRIIHEKKGSPPWLLLDDIFDKLDDFRIEKFMLQVLQDSPQVFITDARPERTQSILAKLNIEANTLLVENGQREDANQLGNT